ncbi:MAG TPA: efflux RND transporter periplasmic adaptor subunit [Bryobacteraceae bacterium]|nr:efflux RND transporter periplasmic adaptor subunit [Bryobacteraceae bacterium]
MEVAQKAAPARRPGGRRWLPLLALAGVLFAGWGAYLLANRPVQAQKAAALEVVPTAVARTGVLAQTLRLTGQTSARRYASIIVARFRGQPGMGRGLVLTKLAEGGTLAKTGDVVAELDSEDMQTTIDDLKSTIDQSVLNLERQKAQLALDWQNLEQTLCSAKANWDRAALDYRKADVLTPIEQEILRLAMEQAEAEFKQQQQSLGYKKVSQEAQLRVSEMALQRQQLRYERSLSDLKGFTFRAPMDGLVVVQSVERSGGTTAQYAAGDTVNPGRAFLRIVDTSSMQVEAAVSQAEATALRVGQPVKVTLDAFPELEFTGSVYSVGAMARPSMFESYYVRTVPVNILIKGQDPRLIPDLSAAAEVLLARDEGNVLVPLEAIQTEGDRTFVYVRKGPQFEKRYVEIGLRGNIDAAVTSGLNAGDRVALSKPPLGS